MSMDPTTTAIGTWSGGRFMHFGEPLDDERLTALLRPGEGIDTVITADVYGEGAADLALGRALAGLARERYCLVGTIGHDFYAGERDGPRGFPRFTDARLRDEGDYASYPVGRRPGGWLLGGPGRGAGAGRRGGGPPGALSPEDSPRGQECAPPAPRRFRPGGWVQAGREKLGLRRPRAARHGLTLLQL